MCFDQKTSFGFAALGFYLAYYVHSRTLNTRLAIGVFWFFLMELLQGFQYFWIDQCDNPWNRILTLVGFIHICYQPYFTHIINSSLTKNPIFLKQYDIILRLCLVGGTMLLARYFLADYSANAVTSDFADWAGSKPFSVGNSTQPSYRTQEWLNGEVLCTYRGKYHLAWSVPMYDPTYFSPSAAIHSFLMFVPFFVLKKNMIIQGVFLWAAGPYLASFITPNLQEQASIWCFFSIAQIGIMLFIIRESLLLNWGRNRTELSIHTQHDSASGKTSGKKTTSKAVAPVAAASAEKKTPVKETPKRSTKKSQ